ncbi:MAG: lipopolysaccharide assembly protein LapA domain-containing protein [Rhodospirillaceae bacterium]
MIKKIIFWSFALVVALVAAAFATSNRDLVTVAFWPTPFELTLPMYLYALAPLGIGLFLGSLLMMLGRARQAIRLRDRELEIRGLRAELTRTKDKVEALEASLDAAEAPKALPKAA